MINFGIIGLGNRGYKYALNTIKENSETKIVHICDENKNHFELFHDCKKTTNYMDVLDDPDVDAVFIATPDNTHGEIIRQALKSSKHILCEKPLEVSISEVLSLEKLLKNYSKVFQVGYVLRYGLLFEQAKSFILQDMIGDVIMANCMDHIDYGGYAFFHDWHRNKKIAGSLLLQKATHSLDLLNWMIDSKPKQVVAFGGLEVFGDRGRQRLYGNQKITTQDFNTWPIKYSDPESLYNLKKFKKINWSEDWPNKSVYDKEIDVDDHQTAMIKYENHAIATYNLCEFSAEYKREFTFFGTKGELYFNDSDNRIIISDRLKPTKLTFDVNENIDHGGGDEEQLLSFIDCIMNHKQPIADINASVQVMKLALSAQESIEKGCMIDIS